MFKEWFFHFIAHIVAVIALTAIVGICIGALGFILWVGENNLVLGISIIVVLGLIGLGIYTFYEVKNEK
jgi:hypothetical protein